MGISTEAYYEALKHNDWSPEKAAKVLGVTARQVLVKKKQMKALGISVPESSYHTNRFAYVDTKAKGPREFEAPSLPDRDRSLEEILSDRKKEFSRFRNSEEARKLIRIKVKLKGPIGINLQGDPHLDDPGCDISAIERDTHLVRTTEGMLAGCIGDLQNAWVGRLGRLYGVQTTTAREAWKLVEWYVKSCAHKWLFVLKGNHDLWAGENDLLGWIASGSQVMAEAHQIRLALVFPNGREVRLSARHDWPGQSMWNPSHGQLRASRFTVHDHLIVGGHRHSGGYQMTYVEASDLISHLIQLGAYKIYDDYRAEKGMNRFQMSPSVTVVVDPDAREQVNLIQVFHDTARAADYLKYLRKRAA